ncbi:probable rhamnogalacturonate lyase B isoform X2 [Dioscorea cayenensis subsp. rotundata]|uniref:rhamnogalacturonan endolyase n=1 Tax=Dioscorea cayennensis subsp. rotundata TaxID=55577 RepID=A0AB40BYE8_DIOCR|nr:probable rhamnogalacturonate lyase B isoform X2 [Dioscorea cayenensis subsp. rotundata]
MVDNGIIKLILSKPEGRIIGLEYNGIDNLLEFIKSSTNTGGYWDLNWNTLGSKKDVIVDLIDGKEFEVIVNNVNQVELSFRTIWNPSLNSKAPLNIDKRFIVLRGSSGFYSYAIFEHQSDWPGFVLQETRIAFKLNQDKFRSMAISDYRQRDMPLPEDRNRARSIALAYPEAVRITKPIDSKCKGEVDDKYQYSADNEDSKVHGWICPDPPTGFWLITPSNEFRTGGPTKQDLTSHVGPTTLAMFVSNHYAGEGLNLNFGNGEYWKKVFGPVFVYLNSSPSKFSTKKTLWNDAKIMMENEVKSWPYKFPASADFEKAQIRGSVSGRLMVQDWGMINVPASYAYVGLAKPGLPGSWQKESKGYQFWTRADGNGSFIINNVRSGVYGLFAWVPSFIGDFVHDSNITITPGGKIELGTLLHKAPRAGPTLWEIGVPDRTASEFFVPDPKPDYVNKLYIKHDRFRQYGLWDRYTDLYPNEDLVYKVGLSVYKRDWFFAHVTRRIGVGLYIPTTWKIQFNLSNVIDGLYTLRIALASTHNSELQVRVNMEGGNPQFTTNKIGKDNAIARHGIHGLHNLFNVTISSNFFNQGLNTIYFTQTQSDVFSGIMYDYIRLEGPFI